MTAWLFNHPFVALAMLWLPILTTAAMVVGWIVHRDRAERHKFVQRCHVRRVARPFDFEAQA